MITIFVKLSKIADSVIPAVQRTSLERINLITWTIMFILPTSGILEFSVFSMRRCRDR